jgi:hypothetical protein
MDKSAGNLGIAAPDKQSKRKIESDGLNLNATQAATGWWLFNGRF